MKLALGTSWLVLALVSTWAAPTPVRQGATLVERLIGPEQTRVYDACINGQPSCLVARQNPNEPQLSEPSNTPASTNASLISSSSTTGTISTSTTSAPLSSTPESTSSLSAPDPFHFDELAAQSNPSNNSGDSDNNNLRTVGIVGGFLAGTALVAIIGIILILIRKQNNRGSSAASSFMSRRSRTRSSTRPPPAPMVAQPYSLPLTVPHPLRIHTGDGMTAASHDLTTAGTLGHQSTGMHMFPSVDVDPGSASSRTTSFGQHSSGTSSGGSNVPRRPPQIPSLGLSNPRPLMRSFGSLFSYHASTGHPTPTATRTALDREEHSEPEHTEVTAPSTFGSRTLAATEDLGRSDDHAQTEETGMSDDVTRTAETAHSGPVEASSDNQPKI